MPHNLWVTTPTPVPGRKIPNRLPSWLHGSDLQGLAQLVTHGVLGVTDLAESVHGNVYKAVATPLGRAGAAWVDRFERMPDARHPCHCPKVWPCFTVAASTSGQSSSIKDQLGDGLVPVRSALGGHDEPGHTLAFAPENQWVARGMDHLALLNRPEVGRQLVRWLQGGSSL